MSKSIELLKEEVCQANLDLVKYDLVTLTWGNVSGIDREKDLVVIKPSGVEYGVLKPSDMVVVNLNGKVVEGNLNPSSDTATHVALYRAFKDIGGVAHSHSLYGTMFAQACQEVPCFGTTHADHFSGSIPVTRFLTESEVEEDYEGNTGAVIIERFSDLNPIEIPAVLVAGHAPFSWGKSADDAVKNLLVLERVSEMVLGTLHLNSKGNILPDYVLRKHYERKHGLLAYYGQKK